MRFGQILGAFALALMATSCKLGDSTEAGSILIDVEVDKATLPIDESTTITLTARNVGDDPVTLSGPSDCLLYVEILDTSGQVVWRSISQIGSCVGSTVNEEVAAGGTRAQSFIWFGTNDAGARLAAGIYGIRGVARLADGPWRGTLYTIQLE